MMIDAPSAVAIATIILTSTQGIGRLRPQLPLHAVDQGENWLVKGTPFTDTTMKLQYCMFYTFINKFDGQIQSIDYSGRPILSETEKDDWHKQMTLQQFNEIFGPPTVFEPTGKYLDLNRALYGGVVNKPDDAIDYAMVLLRLKPGLSLIPKGAVHAEERDGVWHVSAQVPGDAKPVEVLTFARYDGRVLSGP